MTFPARTAVAVGAKVSMWPIRLLKIGSVRGEMDKGGSGNKKKPKGLNAGNNRRFGFALSAIALISPLKGKIRG
jgi:hypothetical protein